MKSEQRKKEDCELLDKLSCVFAIGTKYSVSDIIDEVNQFKSDNDLLPKNVSGWYLSHSFNSWCAYYDFENQIIYGIDATGEWFKRNLINNEIDPGDYQATKQQVEERLFPFFEKMYPKGCKIKSMIFENSIHHCYGNKHSLRGANFNQFWMGENCIMKDGILAELIEESEVDKLKAEIRKLSDKLKELGE